MGEEIIAIVITYNPDEDFIKNILKIREQVKVILIVDNGSSEQPLKFIKRVSDLPNIDIIFNKKNPGVATALNQGFSWACEKKYNYAITFDQDSYPSTNMVKKLVEGYSFYSEPSKVAIVAPNIVDKAVNVYSRHLRPTGMFTFELVTCEYGYLEDISFVITSGSLCNLSAYRDIGNFQDDYFIDYVDLEYCLHALSLGYKILVACEALLIHSLGKREERRFLGRKEYPRFYSPDRWYYQSRNRVFILKRYISKNPFLFFYEAINVIYGIFRMLIYKDRRLSKIFAFFKGTFIGLLVCFEYHYNQD